MVDSNGRVFDRLERAVAEVPPEPRDAVERDAARGARLGDVRGHGEERAVCFRRRLDADHRDTKLRR